MRIHEKNIRLSHNTLIVLVIVIAKKKLFVSWLYLHTYNLPTVENK